MFNADMKYREAIKNGFRIVNKNWQLVLVQVGALLASFAGFLVLVGVPLAIAFIIFGLDLTELSRLEDALRTFREPTEILSRYFTLAVFVLASLLLYLLVVLSVGIFVFGGSIGVISRFLEGTTEKFSMRTFNSEGRRLFLPLTGFTTLVGLMFVLVAFVLGLFGGAIAALVSAAKEQEATLALFLGIFFSLILFVVGLVLILVTLSITVYGAAVMSLKGEGPVKSVKEATRYLFKHADALFFYCVVFVCYMIVIFAIALPGYPLGHIPFIGPLIAFVYQFASYAVQSYLGLVTLAAVIWYYFSSAVRPPTGEATAAETATSAELSTPVTDISGPQAPGQEGPPPEKETKE